MCDTRNGYIKTLEIKDNKAQSIDLKQDLHQGHLFSNKAF